jgi:hypothetical protein
MNRRFGGTYRLYPQEALRSSEMSVHIRTTRLCIPQSICLYDGNPSIFICKHHKQVTTLHKSDNVLRSIVRSTDGFRRSVWSRVTWTNINRPWGRAIAQAVSRRLPTAAARVQTRVSSCGILWWTKVAQGQVFSPRTSVSPSAYLHSICFSTIIFTITRGWHNRPGVAAVPIAS